MLCSHRSSVGISAFANASHLDYALFYNDIFAYPSIHTLTLEIPPAIPIHDPSRQHREKGKGYSRTIT